MGYKLSKNSHSVYSLNYHLIQCIKYRRKIFDNEEIILELKTKTIELSNKYNIKINIIETDLDHVHILFESKPQSNIIKFINNWKSSTSKYLKNKFKNQIKNKLWENHFWSSNYCLITTGQTTLNQIKKYIENQGK